MATTASFKQQCPSCEAMVPIRDPNLVGRKIDCPKCKYRFEVKAPPEEDKDDEKPTKNGKATNGKSTAVKTAPAKPGKDKPGGKPSSVTAKTGKPAAKKPVVDDDDDDDDAPTKKK